MHCGMQQILFTQTQEPPKWSRIEWAQQLLLHAYTRTSPTRSTGPDGHRLYQLVGKAEAAKHTNSSN
jgi:hypothetical protein